ncbi:MAG TPA: thermonuclease family protein [Kiritimatiellia bacterium]|nr:thermonuclease family protein [Kiritimatiellia bacterium]
MFTRGWNSILLAAVLTLAAGDALAQRKWREKFNCTLIPNESNDGDSFHVRWNTRKYLLRTLWVDAPETDNRFPDRVAEQAAYFGISPQDALKVGKEAAKFTTEWLSREPFIIYTQFDEARGASAMQRHYAIVKSGDTYLMEALVSNGLARIHGLQEMHEGGPSVRTMNARLKGLENEARREKRGAWGYAAPPLSRFDQLNQAPEIKPQSLTLSRALPIYSLQDPNRLMGTLAANHRIEVLRAESPVMVRVRFSLEDGRTIEAQVRRTDLGL